MSRKHKLRSGESNCAVGHDAPRSSALPRVHCGRCSPFLDPEGHNFFSCPEPERAILGLADYKFRCEVLVSALLAMVSGNSINPKLYGACPGHFICPLVTALKRLFLVRLSVAVSGLCCVVAAIIACTSPALLTSALRSK
jgi:hypothetical protein